MHTRDEWKEEEQFAEDDDSEEARMLPPRSLIHPSEKGKWTRRFYQLLVLLFILLLVGLLLWGDHYTSHASFSVI